MSDFSVLPIIVPIFFVLVFGIFIYVIAKGVAQNAKNAAAPMERRYARVVTKRTEVWGERSHTDYYVTFELTDGNRLEYEVEGAQFGQLVEGDVGELCTQGTAFRAFNRQALATPQ